MNNKKKGAEPVSGCGQKEAVRLNCPSQADNQNNKTDLPESRRMGFWFSLCSLLIPGNFKSSGKTICSLRSFTVSFFVVFGSFQTTTKNASWQDHPASYSILFSGLILTARTNNRPMRPLKRAEPAFTSAEVRHASKICSRGRFLRNFL